MQLNLITSILVLQQLRSKHDILVATIKQFIIHLIILVGIVILIELTNAIYTISTLDGPVQHGIRIAHEAIATIITVVKRPK